MTVLLTGASGFLGTHVSRLALAAGCEVIVFGRQTPAQAAPNLRFVKGDLADGTGLADVPWETIDRVVHLAAAGVKASRRIWAEAVAVNLVGTQRLLASIAGKARRCPALLVARTSYESAPDAMAVFQDNPYVVTKAAATEIVRLWSPQYPGPVTLGSFFQLYGPGDCCDSVLTYVAKALRAGESPRLGSGQGLRDWLYVEDAARAVLALMDDPTPGLSEYDIGSGELRSVRSMVESLTETSGADSRHLTFDATLDRNDLGFAVVARRLPEGWRPLTSVNDGLMKLYAQP